MFDKFAEFPLTGWLAVILLLAGGVALTRLKKGTARTVWTTKMLSLGAICMALSCVLSLVRLWKMPQGGSVTAASMLPMMLFAYVYGVGPGLTLGAVYGVLQFILKPYFYSLPQFLLDPWMLSVPQVLLDYPVAFAMVGLAGVMRKHTNVKLGLSVGVVLASLGRFIAAVASGVIFFAEYAEGTGLSPMTYSIVYNGSYMAPECVICVLVALLVGQQLVTQLRKNA